MKKLFLFMFVILASLGFHGCEDYLEPEDDNALTEEQVLENPTIAEGLLLKAYQNLPDDIFNELDLAVAADDATSNNLTSNAVRMATGGWQANDNPVSVWGSTFTNLQYLNRFLKSVDEVEWSIISEDEGKLHRQRLTGEAHGLRAWYQFNLLQAHGGQAANGEYLGFPIVTEPLTIEDNLFLPRNTYQECIEQIINDCNNAIMNIVPEYADADAAEYLDGRIEAEDYDAGGPGVGYNDSSEGNNGNQYRQEDVDIEISSQGGFNVGWTADGEYLNFTVSRIYAGEYKLTAGIASNSGAPGSLRVLVGTDESSLTEVAVIQAENTGGWQSWSEFAVSNVPLPGGVDLLIRLEIVGGGFNLDYVDFEKTDGPVTATVFFQGEEYLVVDYDKTMGSRWRNRFSGSAALALRSRAALYAASPAFSEGTTIGWADAADYAAAYIDAVGGPAMLAPNGLNFYLNSTNDEIIWNNSQTDKNNWERENFPPSLFGLGRTNPSHNLVKSFPMANGYPIDHPQSGYDDLFPYIGRDARFSAYVIANGSSFKGSAINTYVGAETDGINSINTSTRTGYYLRKFIDEAVNLEAGATTNSKHFKTHLRQTEVFLNFAEAANEAWGPDGDPNNYGFTARDVIAVIRQRAGISQPDEYLNSLTDKDSFRELIHNERRLELCFEGHRFWDLRRWNKTEEIKQPIEGIFIDENQFDFNVRDVENRLYQDYMIYGPIPLGETLKYDITQNRGW